MKINILHTNRSGWIFFALVVGVGFFSLFLSGIIAQVKAAPLADTGDTFYVDLPRTRSEIVGNSTLRFKLFDDEDSQPEYEAALYQTDCRTKYGTIVTNDYSISDSNNVFTKTWNSDGPILDRASVPDGNYCLAVCVTLRNGPTNYSVCDLRPVALVDRINHIPQITTTVPNTNFIIGQTFGYDVNATDSDGDALTYSLSSGPSFLQINSSTGAITSKGVLNTIGSFSVVVSVSDGHGGTATQKFTIKVVEQPSEEVGSVQIIAPKKDEIFRQDQTNSIRWELLNISVNDVASITVSYSSDAKTWAKIGDVDADKTSFSWDVKEIRTGDYYVKISVKDDSGITYDDISDRFSVLSKKDEDIKSAASIIEVSPGEDAEVDEVSIIKATLVPSISAEIKEGSLKVLVDETDVTKKCVIAEDKVECTLDAVLTAGKHKVSMGFTDTKELKASKEWSFTVNEKGSEEGEGESLIEQIKGSSIAALLLICCLVLLLLLIPWMIYTMWKRRQNGDETYQSDVDMTDSNAYTLEPTTDLGYTNYPVGDTNPSYTPPVTDVTVNTVPATSSDTVKSDMIDGNLEEEEDEFAIGEGNLGDDAKVETNVVAPTPVVTEPSAEGSVPVASNQLGEEDIPDWLKAEDLDNDGIGASTPVDTKGKEFPVTTVEEKKVESAGAEPYSSYGLAPADGSTSPTNNTGTSDNTSGSGNSATPTSQVSN